MSHQALILKQRSGKDLSKLQKQFNAHVKKINDLKQSIQEDTIQLEKILSRVQKELIPLEVEHTNKFVELVYVFDKHYDNVFFKKKEREKIANFITDKAYDLIETGGREELIELYDKYEGEGAYAGLNQGSNEMTADLMKNMMQSMFGVELGEGEVDYNNPEQMQALLEEKMQAQQREAEARQANKKKSDKQIEKEQKIRQEAKNISKAARSIYTDLVKEFHPDLERDETKQAEKTEIMHKIIKAYEEDDLFELLRLKISLQAGDIDSMAMADEQLKYYNKILKEQVSELDNTLWQLRTQGMGSMGGESLLTKFGGDEKRSTAIFAREINRLKKNIRSLADDITQLKNKEVMRTFLRSYEIVEQEEDFELFLPNSFH